MEADLRDNTAGSVVESYRDQALRIRLFLALKGADIDSDSILAERYRSLSDEERAAVHYNSITAAKAREAGEEVMSDDMAEAVRVCIYERARRERWMEQHA